jgi:hypothetical protein
LVDDRSCFCNVEEGERIWFGKRGNESDGFLLWCGRQVLMIMDNGTRADVEGIEIRKGLITGIFWILFVGNDNFDSKFNIELPSGNT